MNGHQPQFVLLDEAQEWLRENVEDGARCPCCTQHAKVYRRKINAGAARALIVMWQRVGQNWCHVPSTEHLSRVGGELARLRFWALIEESPEPREDGGRAGWWRLTEHGKQFILDQVRVAKYARVYDGRCLSLDHGEMVGIRDVLGSNFNYSDLMAGI